MIHDFSASFWWLLHYTYKYNIFIKHIIKITNATHIMILGGYGSNLGLGCTEDWRPRQGKPVLVDCLNPTQFVAVCFFHKES